MALENIRYYEHGEWRPITIEEADRLHDDSVSVDSHAFMCYGCYHYVTFKKNYYRTDGVFVRSQFAHSRGDEEKQCEYRTSLSADGRQAYLCSTLSMPMRLRFDGLHIRIEIGLLPLTIEEIIRAENSHAEIRIKGNQTVIKRIDASNFSPHATTWITVPGEPTSNYKLQVNPPGLMPRSWKAPLTPFTDNGAFFDKETGRRLPVYADVTVGHAYYLLTTKTYIDSSFSYYDNGASLPDVLANPPINGNILTSPSFDGKIQIEDADGLLYETELRAEEEVRIQDLKAGMKLRFYQGLDCIRTIEIVKENQVRKISCNEIVRWAGKPIRLEAKYAWILAYMEPDSLLYKQMLEAFRSGMIPADGLKWINKYAEELIHGE